MECELKLYVTQPICRPEKKMVSYFVLMCQNPIVLMVAIG